MRETIIVPLCSPRALTEAGREAIERADKLFVQTARHPSAEAVRRVRADFTTMDELYDAAEDFDALNAAIARRVAGAGDCVYVATGDILLSQLPAIRAAVEAAGGIVRVLPGLGAGEIAFAGLPRGVSVPASAPPDTVHPELAYVVTEIDSAMRAGEVKLLLLEYYPADWGILFASMAENGSYDARSIPLCELDRQAGYDATSAAYVPELTFDTRTRYGFEDVMRVVRRLRAPGGCPWDREQTHVSLKNALLEECYELLDAIDEGDDAHICEELGDVLLQYALHAVIAEEQAAFTERDAATELVDKLIYRHPHVFGTTRVDDSEEVLRNWDALKKAQRHQTTQTEALRGVPRSFPALLRSRKVQKKAADVGFDWASAEDAFGKIAEETTELREAMERGGDDVGEEMGDLLFAAVNVARLLKLEPELMLAKATEKFIDRFEAMEALAIEGGRAISELSFDEQNELWDRVKKSPKREDVHK